jgi:hypothetical protein
MFSAKASHSIINAVLLFAGISQKRLLNSAGWCLHVIRQKTVDMLEEFFKDSIIFKGL